MLIDQALAADVGHAEKLVLVYLARHANSAGVGYWRRDDLEVVLGYKTRTVQRHLKTLRDLEILDDTGGDWYLLHLGQGNILGTNTLPDDPGDQAEELVHPGEAEDLRAADAFQDTADYLIDQVQNLVHQVSAQADRLALLHVERSSEPPPPPPPDPVTLTPIYLQMIEAGVGEEIAYQASLSTMTDKPEPEVQTSVPASTEYKQYPDTPSGRLQRVADILIEGDANVPAMITAAWQTLEASENKHSVEGEMPAFEQLYPAIVSAARQNVGMDLGEFLDRDKISNARAPWDFAGPTGTDDRVLEAEIQVMLAELEAAAHPQCQVMPRVVEKREDGGVNEESLHGYHRRVSQMHKQLKRLQMMGAA